MKWNNLTVKQYQDVTFANQEPEPFEKICLVIAALYKLSFAQVNDLSAKDFLKKSSSVEALFSSDIKGKARSRIGIYSISYDVASFKWRQYVEIQHFLTLPQERGIPLILASSSARIFGKNTPEDHSKRVAAFLNSPLPDCLFSARQILDNLSALNARFKEREEEVEAEEDQDEQEQKPPAPAMEDGSEDFVNRWGWIYTTKRIAEHRGITLDQAYELTTIQALNDMQYIKDLDKFQEAQIKNAKKQTATN